MRTVKGGGGGKAAPLGNLFCGKFSDVEEGKGTGDLPIPDVIGKRGAEGLLEGAAEIGLK